MIRDFESFEATLIKRGRQPSNDLDLEDLRLRLEKTHKRRIHSFVPEKTKNDDIFEGLLEGLPQSADQSQLATMEDGHKAL